MAPRVATVTLHLAGSARLQPEGDAPGPRLERKQAALLAWLAIEGATSRARLAGLLWPDVAEARARANLRQCLARLRQAGATIDEDGGTLKLAPQVVVAASQPDDATLLEAENFDDIDTLSAWIESRRELQRAQARQARIAEVRLALAANQLDRALAAADRLLAADRESEEAYRTLMEVLYLRADHAAAIGVWDRCREMLRTLYGVKPSPATQHLGELILSASTASAAPAVSSEALPATVLRPPRLAGRDDAMRALARAHRAGQPVCVVGEAGLGKSRLLADFAAGCGPHAVAAARPGDSVLPYAGLSRLLLAAIDRFAPPLDGDDARAAARLLPRLAALTGEPVAPAQTEYERSQALLGTARLLGRCVAAGCRLFVFDDLQFADAPTAEALLLLAEPAAAEARTPLPFAFGSRGGEHSEAADALLARLGEGARLTRIDLAPLSLPAVTELLQSLQLPGLDAVALAPRLLRRVGGNPAFVLESIKLLWLHGPLAAAGEGALPLPPRAREVVERQLGWLSEPARHLAQLAALAGECYSIELAAEVLACHPLQLATPLAELAERRLFDGRAFSHDTAADTVRSSVPAAVATFVHRLIAGHLQRQGAAPAATATHWRLAGEWAPAAAAYLAAARGAEAASLPAVQAQLEDLAIDCAGRGGDRALLFDAIEARLANTASPDHAARRLPLMERLETLAESEEERLRAQSWRIGWRADLGQADGSDAARAAVDKALAIGRPALAWTIAMPLSWQLALGGDIDAALAAVERHRGWVESAGSALARAEFHAALAGANGWGDRLQAAIAHQRAAATAFRAAGVPVRCLPVLANQGLMHHWRGELDAALAVLTEACELRDRVRGHGSAALLDIHRAAVLRDLGRASEAVPLLEQRIAQLSASGIDALGTVDRLLAENHLALTWAALGEPARGEAVLQTDDTGAATHLRARRLAVRLRLARRRGMPSSAVEGWAAAARPLLDPAGHTMHAVVLAIELARWQDAAHALTQYAQLAAAPLMAERPGLRWHLALRSAERALDLGSAAARRDAADALAPWAAGPAGQYPFDLELAEAAAITRRVRDEAGIASPASTAR